MCNATGDLARNTAATRGQPHDRRGPELDRRGLLGPWLAGTMFAPWRRSGKRPRQCPNASQRARLDIGLVPRTNRSATIGTHGCGRVHAGRGDVIGAMGGGRAAEAPKIGSTGNGDDPWSARAVRGAVGPWQFGD